MTYKLTHHELNAEWAISNQEPAIVLSQPSKGSGEPNTILLHPWQLLAICKQFGIIASNPQAEKSIATLTRHMVALRDRIDFLAEWMVHHSDHKHADLSYEVALLQAMQDLACEWCHDFECEEQAHVASQDELPACM